MMIISINKTSQKNHEQESTGQTISPKVNLQNRKHCKEPQKAGL